MAIQGLSHTGTFGGTIGDPDSIPAFERPTNWRQGILMRFPNGHAPLVALSAVMKKRTTDDPQYHWWERELSDVRMALKSDILATPGAGTIEIDASGDNFGGNTQLKAGDLLRLEKEDAGTYEVMKVLATPAAGDETVNVFRGFGGTTPIAVTVATENPYVHLMGSVYPENADTPSSVRYRPVKEYNYTQIFRDSLAASRTAMHTRLRTVDEVRDAKQQTLVYHSIRQEYGWIFGVRNEEVSASGEPERTTGGIISYIPQSNIVDNAGAAIPMTQLEDWLLEAFRWGSQEKMGFCGNRAMLAIQRIARKNASLEITPTIKEFGMDVRRVFSPSGTLVLKTHPLFNQIQSSVGNYFSLDSWLLILDMANLTYRPLRNSDTQYLPDRQSNGTDGIKSEYLTEAGLEVAHGKTHYLIKGMTQGAADA